MESQDVQKALEPVIKQIVKDAFVAGYTATDAEVMGILLAKYFQWDGVQILEAAASALEDSNFHGESKVIAEMLDKLK